MRECTLSWAFGVAFEGGEGKSGRSGRALQVAVPPSPLATLAMGLVVNALDVVIPMGLMSFMSYVHAFLNRFSQGLYSQPTSYGAYVAIFQVGIGWFYLIEQKPIAAVCYTTVATVLPACTLVFYTRLFFHNPPSPPLKIPDALLDKAVPYECVDQDGKLGKCTKGKCNGRWKPPRSHHCSVCGQCRLGFDHHCHWVGNCITMETRKLFLAILSLSSLTVFILVAPVLQPVWKHVMNALDTSLKSEITRDWWWDRWYSWVLVAGPIGRWPVGICFGYRILAAQDDRPPDEHMGSVIKDPSLTLFLLIQIALGLALFTAAMLLLGIKDVLQGKTTFDRMTAPPRGALYWMPTMSDGPGSGIVVACPEGINPYDAGFQRNWSDLMVRPLLGPICRERDVIPNLDAARLQQPFGNGIPNESQRLVHRW